MTENNLNQPLPPPFTGQTDAGINAPVPPSVPPVGHIVSERDQPGKRVKPLIALGIIVLIGAALFSFLGIHQVVGNPVAPFTDKQYVLSENLTYRFQDPAIGDAVIFNGSGISSFIGIITSKDEQNGSAVYTIQSTSGKPWTVDRKDVSDKIWYPPVSDSEITAPAAPTPVPTRSPTPTPLPVLTPTPTADTKPAATPKPTAAVTGFKAYIDGVAYVDGNWNGTRDSFEEGLRGRDINIYDMSNSSNVTLAATAITNDDGYYKATVTHTGRYQPQLGDLNLNYQYPVIRTVLISKQGEIQRLDFGMVPRGLQNPETSSGQGTIQGVTFNDANRNGVQDGGESGIYFFKINLYRTSDNSQVATTVSGDDGSFTFSGLALTSYRIDAYNHSGQYTITKSSADVTLSATHTLDNTARLGMVKNY